MTNNNSISTISQGLTSSNNNNNNNPSSKYHKNRYKRKWYRKEEWINKCNNDRSFNNYILGNIITDNNNNYNVEYDPIDPTNDGDERITIPEPSIPLLLLNYFIIYGYEEAAIRMGKELNIIRNNSDIVQFNKLFMIKERNLIKSSILSGKINNAMTLIDNLFGLSILHNNNDDNPHTNDDEEGDDLYFKLSLLN